MDRATRQHEHADQRSFAQERHAEGGVISADFLMLHHPVFRVGRAIENMNWGALKQHAANRTLPPSFPGGAFHKIFEDRRKAVSRLGAEKTVALRTSDISLLGLTQSSSRLEEGVEYGPQIESRAADDLEHVRRRRLLLQRLTQLVKQAGVLDRDDSLRSEVLD